MKVFDFLNQLRSRAMKQPGYITGETLVGHDNPNKLLVISTWQSVDSWRAWRDHEDRKVLDEKIVKHLIEPTHSETFMLGRLTP
jgi:heme-degrading monooxygenase HmoA